MTHFLAAALLLAALPAILAQKPAPVPAEPVPESGVSAAQDTIDTTWTKMINTTAANITCENACRNVGNGWAMLHAGTPTRALCSVRAGNAIFVGTAQRVGSSYVCQYRSSGTAKTPTSVNARRGFTCGCAYACAGADYDYDWNYDNNGTPSGKPKPGTNNVDYESSKCRKAFWTPTQGTLGATSPKCNCASGCICRSNISTTKTASYITGWMANGATRCTTHLGDRTKYELFHQCRPSASSPMGH